MRIVPCAGRGRHVGDPEGRTPSVRSPARAQRRRLGERPRDIAAAAADAQVILTSTELADQVRQAIGRSYAEIVEVANYFDVEEIGEKLEARSADAALDGSSCDIRPAPRSGRDSAARLDRLTPAQGGGSGRELRACPPRARRRRRMPRLDARSTEPSVATASM
jgi:hypothetical protein